MFYCHRFDVFIVCNSLSPISREKQLETVMDGIAFVLLEIFKNFRSAPNPKREALF